MSAKIEAGWASDGDTGSLLAPKLGRYRLHAQQGAVVGPGEVLGTVQVLGHRMAVATPLGMGRMRVVEVPRSRLWCPKAYGEPLVHVESLDLADSTRTVQTLDPSLGLPEGAVAFSASIEGLFYAAAGPGEPAFVEQGSKIKWGDTIGLIEVMKFFYEVKFELRGCEEGARVLRVGAKDSQPVEPGDTILYVKPLTS